jgi:hypothetical protein
MILKKITIESKRMKYVNMSWTPFGNFSHEAWLILAKPLNIIFYISALEKIFIKHQYKLESVDRPCRNHRSALESFKDRGLAMTVLQTDKIRTIALFKN